MTEAAKVRIGRVRMKNGGADVRVLHRAPPGKIESRIRGLAAEASSYGEQPSAFVGVVFWRSADEPWRPSYSLTWDTQDPDLPLPRLFRVAASEIDALAAAIKAEDRVMRNLGYRRDDDPEGA